MDSGFSKSGTGRPLFWRRRPADYLSPTGQTFLQLCATAGFLFLGTMNNQPDNPNEPLWRRKLSKAERAGLHAQPVLELESRLTDALASLSEAPVPSNFTARVLAAVELEEMRSARPRGWHWNWRLLMPRIAVTAAVLVLAGISLQRYETNSYRIALAKKIALVAVAQPPPSLDALENLDVIQRISQPAHADGELLAALQ
jgi:hypothetical protein